MKSCSPHTAHAHTHTQTPIHSQQPDICTKVTNKTETLGRVMNSNACFHLVWNDSLFKDHKAKGVQDSAHTHADDGLTARLSLKRTHLDRLNCHRDDTHLILVIRSESPVKCVSSILFSGHLFPKSVKKFDCSKKKTHKCVCFDRVFSFNASR